MAIKFQPISIPLPQKKPRRLSAAQTSRDKTNGFDRNAYQRFYMQSVRSSLYHVYVIGGASPPVKIGIARDPIARFHQIQADCPSELFFYAAWSIESKKAALRAEYDAHVLLRERHCRGEWFNVSPDEAILTVQAQGGLTQLDHSKFIFRPPALAPWERFPIKSPWPALR